MTSRLTWFRSITPTTIKGLKYQRKNQKSRYLHMAVVSAISLLYLTPIKWNRWIQYSSWINYEYAVLIIRINYVNWKEKNILLNYLAFKYFGFERTWWDYSTNASCAPIWYLHFYWNNICGDDNMGLTFINDKIYINVDKTTLTFCRD